MATKSQKFAAFDLDGTLFRSNLSLTLMKSLADRGTISKSVYDELDPFYLSWKNREHPTAYQHYDSNHIKLFTKYIKGVPLTEVNRVVADVVEQIFKRTYVFTRSLAQQLREDGYTLIAITASPHEIAAPFAAKYNFDIVCADTITCDKDGNCLHTETAVAGNKKAILQHAMAKHGLSLEHSVAIGDTTGDIGMLELVENPIAFNPSKELFEVAKTNGWKVVIERKDTIYELKSTDSRYYVE